jgi:predicted DCC family thiol-disulfide oxidoreductase YuxK
VKQILFFDQHCPFCIASVNLLIQLVHDPMLLFAPLDGVTAKKTLKKIQMSSVILFDVPTKKCYRRSQAIFLALSHRWAWLEKGVKLWWIFDPLYQVVALIRRLIPLRYQLLSGPRLLP